MSPIIRAFFDRPTGSLQYVFHCPTTQQAAIVDPVWNFYPEAGAVTTESADEILSYVAAENLKVVWVLDTHPHADHFTAARYLSDKLGAPTAIGEKVTGVQKLWKDLYHLGDDLHTDGSQWDRLFAEGDEFMVGEIAVRVMFSPGHTLASITYVAGDAAFVHDTLMMPESGTSRADFPGGSAEDLWTSLRAILGLSPDTRLYIGHDYPDAGAAPEYMATVAEHRLRNRHVKDGIGKAEFITTRTARDATLPLPERMLAALQVNIRGGRLPEAEADGHSYLNPGYSPNRVFGSEAGRFRCLSPLALRVGGNVDGDDHGRPHLGSAIWGKIVLFASIRRSERMTSPRPGAFSVFAMAIGFAGVMDRPSAAPGSLATGRTRRALQPRIGPASSAGPRSAAARRPAAPARAGGAGSSPSRLPSPWRGGRYA
jgi:glyoxylase-like metal-dependent hydrolase (beta-lactamase superfamily II)